MRNLFLSFLIGIFYLSGAFGIEPFQANPDPPIFRGTAICPHCEFLVTEVYKPSTGSDEFGEYFEYKVARIHRAGIKSESIRRFYNLLKSNQTIRNIYFEAENIKSTVVECKKDQKLSKFMLSSYIEFLSNIYLATDLKESQELFLDDFRWGDIHIFDQGIDEASESLVLEALGEINLIIIYLKFYKFSILNKKGD